MGDLTLLLAQARAGDTDAAARLWPMVQAELARIAHRKLRAQRRDHSLQTTALVNEAYIKLFPGRAKPVKGLDHFLALAARAMRSILVDHAKSKLRDKRRARGERLVIDEIVLSWDRQSIDLIALDEALEELQRQDPDLVELLNLRFFAGLDVEEVAEASGRSKRTVERELAFARQWLARRLA